MTPIENINLLLLLSWRFVLGEGASLNVTMLHPNSQNGSAISIAAIYDPTITSIDFNDLVCEYTNPAGGGPTPLTQYNRRSRQIVLHSLGSAESVRWNITSPGNPMVLLISPVTFNDEKRQFYCKLEYYDAASTLHVLTSKKYTLENVYSKAVLNDVKSMQMSTTMTEGATSNLTCIATGRPAPAITWQYNSTISASVSNKSVGSPLITVTSMLTIQNPSQALQNETITCFVRHPFTSTMNRTTSIHIYLRPEISIPSTITVVEEQDVVLQCKIIAANPVANVTWRSPDGSETLSPFGRVALTSVNRRQNGVYSCFASNGIGSVSSKATYLSVNYGPEFLESNTDRLVCIGESVSINCNAVGHPAPDVFLYLNGTLLNHALSNLRYNFTLDSAGKFRTYTCVSNNTFGTVNVTNTFIMKASGRVNNVIMHVKESAIRVTWELPQCSGNIREIKVQYRKKGQTNWQWELKAATIADTEMTITGLEKGVEYEVRVVVVDTNGKAYEMIGTTAANAESQSTDNGALIGGIIGGLSLLIIIAIAFVLVARKHRHSSADDDRIGRTTNSGIDEDTIDCGNTEIRKYDDIHCTIPDWAPYENVQSRENKFSCLSNKNLVAESDGACSPGNNEGVK